MATPNDNWRWLVGVGISVVFGLFGVVMALLSYAANDKPSPASRPNPAAAEPESPHSTGHGRRSGGHK